MASTNDARVARDAGANRLELNAALELGGLTPSHEALRATLDAIDIPIIAMARPRPGGFTYSEEEWELLCNEARAAIEMGAAGVAFGALTAHGSLDPRCAALAAHLGQAETVFHRAFDAVTDAHPALEQLIDWGFTRVLTSGQRSTALEGAGLIAALRDRAAGRIEILPGSGVTPYNATKLITQTGCTQIHGSFRIANGTPASGPVHFNVDDNADHYATDARAVHATRNALDELASRSS